jgi:hypothetical protein
VEFLISPNPGEPLRPLVKIASGGETSTLSARPSGRQISMTAISGAAAATAS